jgi:hypothetical protein
MVMGSTELGPMTVLVKPITVKIISKEVIENRSWVPEGGPTPGRTGRLTIGPKITLALRQLVKNLHVEVGLNTSTMKNAIFCDVMPCGSCKKRKVAPPSSG